MGTKLNQLAIVTMSACAITTAGFTSQASADDTRYYSIGSFHAGTTPYVYAGMLAGLTGRELDEIVLTAEATGGTTENLDLIRRGEVALSVSSPAKLHAAHNGIGNYEGNQTNVLILWQFMTQASVMATNADSGIEDFTDLKGTTVAVGPAGSSNEVKNSAILEAYGYTREEDTISDFTDVEVVRMSYPEAANALAEGVVDAVIMTQGHPDPSFSELAFRRDLRFIPVDAGMFDDVKAIYPALWQTTIPAGTYEGQNEPLRTLGDPNYIVASGENLSEKDAYTLTKTYVEEVLPQMAEQLAYTKPYASDPSLVSSTFVVPPHPGAARYYQEAGFEPEIVDLD